MINSKYKELTKLIASNWEKTNFLETEIASFNKLGFFLNNKKINVLIEENKVQIDKSVTSNIEPGGHGRIRRYFGEEYYVETEGIPSMLSNKFLYKTHDLSKALEYLLYSVITPGERPSPEKLNKLNYDITKRWSNVIILEEELESCNFFTIEVDEKIINVNIQEKILNMDREDGRKRRSARITRGVGDDLYLVTGDNYDPYSKSFETKNLRGAVAWAIEARVVPNCGIRPLDAEVDISSSNVGWHNKYVSQNYLSSDEKRPKSLYFFPADNMDGLMFDIRADRAPAKFRRTIPLNEIKVIEQTMLIIPLPCCGMQEGVVLKSKRDEPDYRGNWLYEEVLLAHPVDNVDVQLAKQMKILSSYYEITSTPAVLEKFVDKKIIGLIGVTGEYFGGNMDYCAAWQYDSALGDTVLLLEPLNSSGKIQHKRDIDKVEEIVSRSGSNHWGIIEEPRRIERLRNAFEKVRKQAALNVYRTNTLDSLGIE
jgi:hypothetical protein